MTDVGKIHWILVTGASIGLSREEVEIAGQVGSMLAREGYGLIVGDWDGVDWLVRESFLDHLPEADHPNRIKHIANYHRLNLVRVPYAQVLPNDGPGSYSRSSILASDAGIIISGRTGSKPAMDALMRHGKPVLPIPFLGWDSFEIYRDMLEGWNERPVPGLTEAQFLELMKPWRRNPKTLSRLLRASLATEPEIFISYRRKDVPTAAGMIFEGLAHSYGGRSIFIDYQNMQLGANLEGILDQARKCKVLVAIIGPNWDTDRLKQDGDHVRRELEIANEEKMTTIPILLGRDAPPSRSEIPASLSFIWDLKFATFQMDDWAVAMQQLKSAIDAALSPRRALQT